MVVVCEGVGWAAPHYPAQAHYLFAVPSISPDETQVLGSRGMGAVRSTLMSLVGLGSVSAYCLHHLACPVCVVRGKGLEAPRKPVNKVLVPVDDSEAAQHALRWAADNVVGPQDELHIVCVAFPVPYVVG